MKLNQLPNLRTEDFPSEQKWISKLFVQLNPFIQAVNQVINQNLNFGDNLKSVSQTYTITSFQAFSIAWPYADENPKDVRITTALKGTQKDATILLLAWKFNSTTRGVDISRIVEVLDSGIFSLNGTYEFTVRVTV